jgi:hypothetical protein
MRLRRLWLTVCRSQQIERAGDVGVRHPIAIHRGALRGARVGFHRGIALRGARVGVRRQIAIHRGALRGARVGVRHHIADHRIARRHVLRRHIVVHHRLYRCYQWRRIMTPYGWRLRWVNVCRSHYRFYRQLGDVRREPPWLVAIANDEVRVGFVDAHPGGPAGSGAAQLTLDALKLQHDRNVKFLPR